MKKLAIEGHNTRGNEIIELLEMLGGKNIQRLRGVLFKCYYIIDNQNISVYMSVEDDYVVYTLEEFNEKFPYKVGDRVFVPEYESEVIIDKMYWNGYEIQYEVYTDEVETYSAEELNQWNSARCETAYQMKDITGEIYKDVIIDKVDENDENEENLFHTTDEYEEIVEKSFQGGYEKCKLDIQLNGYELPDGYHFTDENGNVIDVTKILIKKNSPTYPKTCEECCDVLNIPNDERYIDIDVPLDYNKVLSTFVKLLICRDAYWKIAGEQIGLGKSWEPVWDESEDLYTVYTFNGEIRLAGTAHRNAILIFPTEEMQEAFYNNFRDLIEQCKELL